MKEYIKKFNVPKISFILYTGVILIALILNSWYVIHGEIIFHTDIARDFLLLQETVSKLKPPLIGPRAGGVSGLFHGPLWLYINLPAYIIGNGNPVVVGGFWVMLQAIAVFSTFYVGKRVFNTTVGAIASVLLSFALIPTTPALFNPSGGVLLAPLFLYFLYKYVDKKNYKDLVLSLLLVGGMIQFQIAFGGPILILSSVLLLYIIIKNKNLLHFSAFLFLIFPFSTYILFDIRHEFLQLNSIISNFGNSTGNGELTIFQVLENRKEMFINNLTIFHGNNFISVIIFILMIYTLYQALRNKKLKGRTFVLLFGYFYIGFLPLSFLLNGYVQSYHTIAFLPLTVLVFSSSIFVINRYVFAVMFFIILGGLFKNSIEFSQHLDNSLGKDTSSWQFNKKVAEAALEDFSHDDTSKEMGYFVYSSDEYGYSPKFALSYVINSNNISNVYPNEKKEMTYLFLSPFGQDTSSQNWWIKNKVYINKEPTVVAHYPNGFRIVKYKLNKEEQGIPPDPNLIQNLIFR